MLLLVLLFGISGAMGWHTAWKIARTSLQGIHSLPVLVLRMHLITAETGFQWAFCATGATIVSGAVAERTQTYTYLAYSVIMTGLIYPIIVYWTWSGEGFLTNKGYSDFAGSGVVHLTGGVGALVGAIMVG